jgi:phosphatidylinositol-3-phosphatase
MIVLSPYAKGQGHANTSPCTHSSTLRTIQRMVGVTPFLRDAAHATDLSDLFAITLPATDAVPQRSRAP